ncbi:PREDICTED: AH receptor-interacting protein-like, partial [Priapulus caudatus]|uniref:AH receptor-interacting protein-like n=1 Tax=Priapulus caudatus TaxID=37621 RepID=A0ABM1EUV0_PRICU
MAGKMIIGPDADNCGVQKKVLYPGVGELPDYSPNTKIHFHFRTLRRNDDRTVLDDTKNSKKPFELIVGKKFKLDCWELCLKTMRLNEVAQFSVHKSLVVSYPIVAKQLRDIIAGRQPQEHRTHCCGMMALQQMGLGHADLEQMLKEPEDLDFIFEVCKIDYAGDYRKDAWAMDEEEKLSQVPVLRDEGNRLYKAGDIAGAAQKYGEALTNLEQLCLREKPGDEEYLVLDRQKIPLLLNFSQCRLLQKDYYPVIE